MTDPPDRPGHPVRQFRVDTTTWRAFMALAGDKAAGSTLRRLIALYLDPNGARLRARVDRIPDPSPDRRPLPRAPRS